MAWQQQPGGYDNYGSYIDTSYAQNDQQNQHYYISLGVPCAMVLCCGIQSTYAAISFMKKVYSPFFFFLQPTQQLAQGLTKLL